MKQAEALVQVNGSFYKFGLRGYVYVLGEDEWVRSNKEEKDIKHAWENEFMGLLDLPYNIDFKDARAQKEIHRAKMEPYMADGLWKSIQASSICI